MWVNRGISAWGASILGFPAEYQPIYHVGGKRGSHKNDAGLDSVELGSSVKRFGVVQVSVEWFTYIPDTSAQRGRMSGRREFPV